MLFLGIYTVIMAIVTFFMGFYVFNPHIGLVQRTWVWWFFFWGNFYAFNYYSAEILREHCEKYFKEHP